MHKPALLGILNLTTDSFSDGGQFLDPDDALAHAATLRHASDIIDIGAASSHPDSHPVPPALEIERLARIVPHLQAQQVSLSIDSFQPEVQLWALEQKEKSIDWLNDIQGFADPRVQEALADSPIRLFVMHSIQPLGAAKREAAPEGDIWSHVMRFFDARLTQFDKRGIARERLVLDPGLGFFLGDKPEPSLQILATIKKLKAAYGLPVLLSASRKSFLRHFCMAPHASSPRDVPLAQSAPLSLAAELWAALQGVDYIRTHEPRPLRDALNLWEKLSAQQG